jgi:hypothetical protein
MQLWQILSLAERPERTTSRTNRGVTQQTLAAAYQDLSTLVAFGAASVPPGTRSAGRLRAIAATPDNSARTAAWLDARGQGRCGDLTRKRSRLSLTTTPGGKLGFTPHGLSLCGSISSMCPLKIVSSWIATTPLSSALGELSGSPLSGTGLRGSSGTSHKLSRGPMIPPRAFSDSALAAASGSQGAIASLVRPACDRVERVQQLCRLHG